LQHLQWGWEYPTICQREASTAANVRDGEPLVIGELTRDSSTVNKSKLPLLGLPATTEYTSKAMRELSIVVTPQFVKAAAAK